MKNQPSWRRKNYSSKKSYSKFISLCSFTVHNPHYDVVRVMLHQRALKYYSMLQCSAVPVFLRFPTANVSIELIGWLWLTYFSMRTKIARNRSKNVISKNKILATALPFNKLIISKIIIQKFAWYFKLYIGNLEHRKNI